MHLCHLCHVLTDKVFIQNIKTTDIMKALIQFSAAVLFTFSLFSCAEPASITPAKNNPLENAGQPGTPSDMSRPDHGTKHPQPALE
jgi:hypothetical protein